MIDYHSYGELTLYPEGWQVQTEATDDPLLSTLAGRNETDTAIPGYDPDLSAELYTMNGDVTDDALHNYDVQAYTVELTAGSGPAVGGTDGTHPSYTPDGFAFQDSEADVQTVFEENLPFALDLARSTPDPDDPVSHIGNTAPDFVPNAFPTSYGDPQTVEVNAKRELGTVWAEWLVVETGRRGAVRTSEWDGGIRYGEPGVYYHKLRADIRTGARAGQTVRVRFTARNARSQAFTYTARATRPRGRADHGGGGLQGPELGGGQPADAVRRAEVPRLLRGGARRRGHRLRRLRHGRDAYRAASARRPLALQGRDLVHGGRLPDPSARASRAPRVWRSCSTTRCSPPATT